MCLKWQYIGIVVLYPNKIWLENLKSDNFGLMDLDSTLLYNVVFAFKSL